MSTMISADLPAKPYTVDGAVLEVKNVSKVYPDPKTGEPRLILRDVNFTVEDHHRPDVPTGQGEVVAIIGRSGRGKTTFANILAGLEKPTSGELTHVFPDGSRQPIRPGEVGFVFQNYKVFEHMTVRENLEYAACQGMCHEHAEHRGFQITKDRFRARSSRRGEIRDRAEQYIVQFSLDRELDQTPDQLSGGQNQRLAILMQVLCSSQFIVMDEPFSGQDHVNKIEACELIQTVSRVGEQQTVFIITHDVDCALYTCDTILPLGFEKDPATGKFKPGATVYKPFSVAEAGLAWQPVEVMRTPKFNEVCNTIKFDWYPNM